MRPYVVDRWLRLMYTITCNVVGIKVSPIEKITFTFTAYNVRRNLVSCFFLQIGDKLKAMRVGYMLHKYSIIGIQIELKEHFWLTGNNNEDSSQLNVNILQLVPNRCTLETLWQKHLILHISIIRWTCNHGSSLRTSNSSFFDGMEMENEFSRTNEGQIRSIAYVNHLDDAIRLMANE